MAEPLSEKELAEWRVDASAWSQIATLRFLATIDQDRARIAELEADIARRQRNDQLWWEACRCQEHPDVNARGNNMWGCPDCLELIKHDNAQLKHELAEAKGALVEMRLALESYKTVAEGEMRTCQCRNCLDDRARLMRSRVLWLLPATNAALASDGGKAHAERDRKMETALRAARAWIIEVLVSENEASPENSHTVRQIDDALAGAKEEASNG